MGKDERHFSFFLFLFILFLLTKVIIIMIIVITIVVYYFKVTEVLLPFKKQAIFNCIYFAKYFPYKIVIFPNKYFAWSSSYSSRRSFQSKCLLNETCFEQEKKFRLSWQKIVFLQECNQWFTAVRDSPVKGSHIPEIPNHQKSSRYLV